MTRWTNFGRFDGCVFKFDYCTGDISRPYGAVCVLYRAGLLPPSHGSPCVDLVLSVSFRNKNLREEYLSNGNVNNDLCRYVAVECHLPNNSGVNRELCESVEGVTGKTLFV
jgi:hypothetical protein